MSSLVSQSYVNLFGTQSPLNKIITESGVYSSVSKNMLNVNSQLARKRMFDMYMLANIIFPNDTLEINDYIRTGIKELINPFFKYNIDTSIDTVTDINPSEYSLAELKCSTNIAKVTGIKNVTVLIMKCEQEVNTNKHGIITYIDYDIASDNNGLNVKWSNGFFKFENPNNINITIFIPQEYIKHTMLNVQSISSKDLATGLIPNLIFRDNCFEVIMADLIKSFFVAIYTDGYKIKSISDMMSLFKIFKNEGQSISNKLSPADADKDKAVIEDIKTRYNAMFSEKFKGYRDVSILFQIGETIGNRWEQGVAVSPKDFYDLFVAIPYSEVMLLMDKVPALTRIISDYDTLKGSITFENGIKSFDIFMIDDDRDIIPYALKIMRYLPFILYNCYMVGASGEHGRITQFVNGVKGLISSINNYKTTNKIYGNICNFITNNLNFMVGEMYDILSSPQYVSTATRRIATQIIIDDTIYK